MLLELARWLHGMAHERLFALFSYITFRGILSALTSLALSLWMGPGIIRRLAQLKGGQPIRTDGPESHFVKAGTPTMGGVLIILAVALATLLWADLRNRYVWIVLGVKGSEWAWQQKRWDSVEHFRRGLWAAHQSAFEPSRILVVEDDPDQREVLQQALEDEFVGSEVECVPDGAAALAAFDRKPAAVVVSDLQMPTVDGASLTQLLRLRADARTVPIILLTASGGPEEWRQLAALGADRFIVKPAHVGDLANTIRRAVRERATLG